MGFSPKGLVSDDQMAAKISNAGTEAARRRFTPEFINRIDKTVVFHALGARELRRVLEIELQAVEERIGQAKASPGFVMNVSDSAREFLLMEGTDIRYGARPLKRAIERLLVQPISNLIVTGQIRQGDCIRVTHGPSEPLLAFFREAEVFRSLQADRVAA